MARSSGLAPLVAPVRPNQKHLYPLTPIERYVAWQRSDGLPFDPWLRVHARLGGKVVRCEPRAMEITAPVQEWEAWTGMAFPEDGPLRLPGRPCAAQRLGRHRRLLGTERVGSPRHLMSRPSRSSIALIDT